MIRSVKEIGCYTFSESQNAIDPNEIKKNSLIVFDDVVNDREINKTAIRNIFTLGRHRCLDVIYIIQSYSKLDKHLIRDNSNMICIFKQDNLNLKHIYDDFSVSSDMTFKQFKELCFEVWKKPFNFVCISKEHGVSSGRYRKNFDEYLHI